MGSLLSIIIPVYKAEGYLRDCLASILEQSYQDLEVILIDDGSPDDCGRICDDYARRDCRIRVIHQQNRGQAIARNAGLDLAKGEYITFVDSDDRIAPHLLRELMSQSPFQMLIFGCTQVETATGKTRQILPPAQKDVLDWREDSSAIEALFRSSLFGYMCSKVYHRSVLEGLRFRDIKLREDLSFNIEAGRRVRQIRVSQEAGYFYQIHPESTLHSAYHGPVPDIAGTAKLFLTIHPQLVPAVDRAVTNHIIKTYLLDALHKYVFTNSSLTDGQRKHLLRSILRDRQIRTHLRSCPGEGALFRLLTLSYKLQWSAPLYGTLKRMWRP